MIPRNQLGHKARAAIPRKERPRSARQQQRWRDNSLCCCASCCAHFPARLVIKARREKALRSDVLLKGARRGLPERAP